MSFLHAVTLLPVQLSPPARHKTDRSGRHDKPNWIANCESQSISKKSSYTVRFTHLIHYFPFRFYSPKYWIYSICIDSRPQHNNMCSGFATKAHSLSLSVCNACNGLALRSACFTLSQKFNTFRGVCACAAATPITAAVRLLKLLPLFLTSSQTRTHNGITG